MAFMKRAAALFFACFACGQIEGSNNGLSGKWFSIGGDDCEFTLELSPGPNGVQGSGLGSIDCSGKWSVSTLSDHETMRWTFADGETQDFVVMIRSSCGLPVTQLRPDQVNGLELRPSTPGRGLGSMTFSREAPAAKCPFVFPPSG